MRFRTIITQTISGLMAMTPMIAAQNIANLHDGAPMGLRLGGCGGVYFLAEPGELRVRVYKQDRNRRDTPIHLRAILAGPDRTVLREEWLLDDGIGKGNPGEPQSALLVAQVPAKGIYALNITASGDRYGNEFWWGFRTNCPKFLVETSRGHRDRRHEEPILVANPEIEGAICFQPEPAGFAVELQGLPAGVEPPQIFDAHGALVQTFAVGADGKASVTIPADATRGTSPWRLRLPSFQATVQIDGVTRWRKGDLSPDLSLWTPVPDSWFAFHANRWALTPYSRTVYGRPGDRRELSFRVENMAREDREFALAVEPSGPDCRVELATDRLTVKARGSATVAAAAHFQKGNAPTACRLRVTPCDDSGFTTYSTIALLPGEAPAGSPLPIPLDLRPYRHENEQFGYLPEYPLDNQVYFDLRNRPFVPAGNSLWAFRDGAWQRTAVPSLRSTKIAFDADNTAYLLATVDRQPALLHSSDGGLTFGTTTIPGGGTFDIEQYSGQNTPRQPPPFIRITRTAKDEKLIWRSVCDLDLFLPRKDGGAIVVGDPIPLSKLCIGLSNHSGMPSSIVSRGDKVHVVWGEATDPEAKAPGVPTYVATYDRSIGKLGEPQLVGHGPPANDVHNTPCIAIDSKGILHVLIGTHGRAFRYTRSLQPNDACGGWTPAEEVGPGLSQTYVGLVCDPDDTLHLVFRLWLRDSERFRDSSFASLARMSKPAGQPWSKPVPLVLAPFSDYSIFYHRLTIDRRGRLFLSYDYWSTYWFYRTDHRGGRRALMFSPDAGLTWRLAGNRDLAP